MKKYTVSNHFWITAAFAGFTLTDLVQGLMRYSYSGEENDLIAWLILAVPCFVVSVILWYRGERIWSFESKPFEESREYVHAARGANFAIKEEIVRRQKNVRRLEEEQKGLLKVAIGGAVVTLIGGFIFMLASTGVEFDGTLATVYQSYMALTYPALALGAVIMVFGFRMLWHCFVNSDSSFAYAISEKYSIDSCSVRIHKENILIGVLQKRLEKEIAEEKRKREEWQRQEKEQMEKVFVTIPDEINLRG